MKWSKAEAWAHQVECDAEVWIEADGHALAHIAAEAVWQEWIEEVSDGS